jgi:DNA-binding transcriptional LysR family regulator
MALHLVPRGLLYLEAIVEHGSIQAASRAIGISASAIDRQIVLLEERLGARLFDRVPTGMALTPAGEMFLVLARRWQADESRVWSDVKQMQGVELGHIRLVTMDSLVNGPIPTFLAAMSETYPRVRVDVEIATPDDAVDRIVDGAADIGLAFNVRPRKELHVMWSATLPLVCVAAPDHPLARRTEVSLGEISGHALVLQNRALTIRRILEARHGWIFSEGGPPVATNSLQLLKQLAVAGTHVALTSELDVAPELLDGRLVAIPIGNRKATGQSISVVINARRTVPRICLLVAERLSGHMEEVLRAVRQVGAA